MAAFCYVGSNKTIANFKEQVGEDQAAAIATQIANNEKSINIRVNGVLRKSNLFSDIIKDFPNTNEAFEKYLSYYSDDYRLHHDPKDVDENGEPKYVSKFRTSNPNIKDDKTEYLKHIVIKFNTLAKNKKDELAEDAAKKLNAMDFENKDNYTTSLAFRIDYLYNSTKLREYDNLLFGSNGISYINFRDIMSNSTENESEEEKRILSNLREISFFLKGIKYINNITNLHKDLSESEKSLNDEITNLKSLLPEASKIEAEVNKLISEYFRVKLTSISPDIKLGIRELFDISDDEYKHQLLLDAMQDTNVPMVASFIKRFIIKQTNMVYESDEKVRIFKKNIEELLKQGYTFDSIMEDNSTGKLISEFKEEYRDDYKTYSDKLHDLIEKGNRYTKDYYDIEKEFNKWKIDNLLNESNDEVLNDRFKINDILFSNFEARKIYDDLHKELRIIESVYDNAFDKYNIRDEDLIKIDELRRKLREAGNTYNLDGTVKTGKDLEIANTIKAYNEALLEHMTKYFNTVVDADFNYNLEVALKNNDTRWLELNTKKILSDELFTKLEEANKVLGREKKENEFAEQFKLFRDADGIINGNNVPDNIRQQVLDAANESLKEANEKAEDRLPKAIETPNKRYVTNDEYTKMFESMGILKRNSEAAYKNKLKKLKNLLIPYIYDGKVNYDIMPDYHLAMLLKAYDELSYVNSIYSKDDKRTEFNEWFAKNHETIIDYDQYNKSERIAESLGKDHLKLFHDVNLETIRTKEFYDAVEELRELYGIEVGKSKTMHQVFNFDIKAFRRIFKIGTDITSFADLTKYMSTLSDGDKNIFLKFIANSKRKNMNGDDYTLTQMVYSRTADSEIYNPSFEIQENIIHSISQAKRNRMYTILNSTDSNKGLNRLRFNYDYNNMFEGVPTEEYKELLHKHGTRSKWYYDNHTIDSMGNIIPVDIWVDYVTKIESHSETRPKSSMWGYNRLTNEEYIDKAKSEAQNFITDNIITTTTKYYNETNVKNRDSMTEEEYNKWWDDNHTYNPYSNKYQPIKIWTKIDSNTTEYIKEYEPKNHLTKPELKKEYSNIDNETDPYRTRMGYPLPKKSSKYYNESYESIKDNKLYKLVVDTLSEHTKHYDKETMLSRGFMPVTRKSKFNIASKIGWYSHNNNESVNINDETIILRNLPFSSKLKIKTELPLPRKEAYNSDEDYQKAKAEVIAKNKEIAKLNNEFHVANLNTDWENVLATFIKASSEHKFKQEFDDEFRLFIEKVKKSKFYKKRNSMYRLRSKTSKDKLHDVNLANDNDVFGTISGEESNVLEHLEMFYKMIFNNQFEADEGTFTKAARVVQNFTSAKNMWLNTTGAINNVNYGLIQIATEQGAGYFFDTKARLAADKQYMSALIPTIASIGKDTTTNKYAAILKYFDIIESQDEIAITNNVELDRSIRKELLSTNSLYILHHAGEHYMQSLGLLAMVNSHRVVNGKIMSLADYTFSKRYDALVKILMTNELRDFDRFIIDNKNKDRYLDGRSDLIRDFILSLPIDKQRQYNTYLKQLSHEYELNFKQYKTLESTIEFKNGMAVFPEITQSELSEFKAKVISVNQKIHGIYSKLGASTIQHFALGRIAMQFKKWMRPQWNRRFGTKFGKSFWNEQRSELDKGMYISTFQFLFKPVLDNMSNTGFRQTGKENTFEQAQEAFKNVFRDYRKYIHNINVYWNTLNDTDKANIKRTLIELGFTVTVMVMLQGLKSLGDDDDELQDTKLFSYSIYTLDRLRSELRAYDPLFGWFNESKKLLRDPFAAMSTIEDLLKLLYTLTFEHGEYYRGGAYSKQSKEKIQLLKNIPLFNRYLRYSNIENYTGYYKLY